MRICFLDLTSKSAKLVDFVEMGMKHSAHDRHYCEVVSWFI